MGFGGCLMCLSIGVDPYWVGEKIKLLVTLAKILKKIAISYKNQGGKYVLLSNSIWIQNLGVVFTNMGSGGCLMCLSIGVDPYWVGEKIKLLVTLYNILLKVAVS